MLGHHQHLLDVEAAFCQLKSYQEVRPIYHWRPDREAQPGEALFYWLLAERAVGAGMAGERGEGEVPRILRRLQSIRIGQLQVLGQRGA